MQHLALLVRHVGDERSIQGSRVLLLQARGGVGFAGFAHARDLLLNIGQERGDFVAGVDADALDVCAAHACGEGLALLRCGSGDSLLLLLLRVDAESDGLVLGFLFDGGMLDDGGWHLSDNARWRR